MPDPGLILSHLSREYNVPMPRYVLGHPLPKRILAVYDEETGVIYFRSFDPSIHTIAHEFAHYYLAEKYGRVPKALHERMAREFEDFISNLYYRTNLDMVYTGYRQTVGGAGLLLPLIGTGLIGLITDSLPHPSLPPTENRRRMRNLIGIFMGNLLTTIVSWMLSGGGVG